MHFLLCSLVRTVRCSTRPRSSRWAKRHPEWQPLGQRRFSSSYGGFPALAISPVDDAPYVVRVAGEGEGRRQGGQRAGGRECTGARGGQGKRHGGEAVREGAVRARGGSREGARWAGPRPGARREGRRHSQAWPIFPPLRSPPAALDPP